jgi:hypothetical protein
MECSTGVIDLVSLTEGVKIIPLPRVLVPRHLQRIHDGADTAEPGDPWLEPIQLGIDKAHIKRGVMDHQLCTSHKLDKFLCDLTESRLTSQKLLSDAVHLERAGIDVPLRLYILVIVAPGDPPVHELYAANLNNAVTLIDL